jgi:hypothetical protein
MASVSRLTAPLRTPRTPCSERIFDWLDDTVAQPYSPRPASNTCAPAMVLLVWRPACKDRAMSRTVLVIAGVVVLALVAAMGYFGLQRDTGLTVILVAVVLLAALGAAIVVSRRD